MDNAILTKVIELAADQGGVDPANVCSETHFINDLNFDSLDVVEFTMSLEDAFGLSVPDEDAENLRTVGQVTEYVERQRQAVAG